LPRFPLEICADISAAPLAPCVEGNNIIYWKQLIPQHQWYNKRRWNFIFFPQSKMSHMSYCSLCAVKFLKNDYVRYYFICFELEAIYARKYCNIVTGKNEVENVITGSQSSFPPFNENVWRKIKD